MPDISLRRPTADDIPDIEEVAKHYDFPLHLDKFETAAVVEINGEIKSYGITRHILEAVLYCDGSDRDKVISLKQLIDRAKKDAFIMGHDDFYVFVSDENFANILIKKFGFERPKIGIPLICRLGDYDGK